MPSQNILVAVAWPYVNGEIHVGHLAGYLLPADAFARWARLRGHRVLMVSGADCHGTPITVEAEKRHLSPQQLIDTYLPQIKELIKLYDLSYDLFTTTQTPNHQKIVQEFFLKLLKNGYIFKKEDYQYYSPSQKRFLPDRYVEGECPYCHSPNQRADQCEVCGRVLDSGQLINPRSKLDGQKVILKKSEHYYLDYPKLEKEIKDFVLKSKHWRPWVWQETMGWLKEGLKPRPISRDLEWGIPFPKDKIPPSWQLKNMDKKRFYVWFDAVIGYVSAVQEYAQKKEKNGLFSEFWHNPNSRHYYFMGQDNLAFHTIFWPGQLIGQKDNYTLPYQECVNKFLTLEGKKFSKSRGVIINSLEVGREYHPDMIRFYLFSILPENHESSWYWTEFARTINGVLVDKIANFFQRVALFQKKFFGGELLVKNVDPAIIKYTHETFASINQKMESCSLGSAFKEVIGLSNKANLYLNQEEPWRQIKTSPAAAKDSLATASYLAANLATLLLPFTPSFSQRALSLLGLDHITTKRKIVFAPFPISFKTTINTSFLPLAKKVSF